MLRAGAVGLARSRGLVVKRGRYPLRSIEPRGSWRDQQKHCNSARSGPGPSKDKPKGAPTRDAGEQAQSKGAPTPPKEAPAQHKEPAPAHPKGAAEEVPKEATKWVGEDSAAAIARLPANVRDIYHQLESSLLARVHIPKVKEPEWIPVYMLTSALLVVWVMSAFGGQIRSFFGAQTAEVAKEAMRQESIQVQTKELATAVVHTMLTNQEVRVAWTEFLTKAASNPETETALVGLARHVLQHPDTLAEVNKLAVKVVQHLSKNPEVVQDLTALTLAVLQEEETHAAFGTLLVDLSQNEEVYNAMVEMSAKVVRDPRVTTQFGITVTESSHAVLSDENILLHSKDFVSEVLEDEAVQQTGGDAIWQTVQRGLRSKLLKATGFGLLAASAVIIGRSTSAA
ncbi:unnamed protein product [Chrysoparadoxa australica]